MTVERKQKQYDAETIARARYVQADMRSMRASVDRMRGVEPATNAWPRITYLHIYEVLCDLRTLYESLGDNPGDVANCLGAMDIRGVLFGVRCCPLGAFTRLATGLWCEVIYGHYAIVTGEVPHVWHALPAPCAGFMSGFDAGSYPWLEREPQGDEGAVKLASNEEHTYVV
jgi:hypothetical protein